MDNNSKMNVEVSEQSNVKTVNVQYEIETDTELIGKANLGKRKHTCKVCGAKGEFQSWRGIEMFVGLRDEFEYFECPVCQCLQIDKFPEDIGKYYAHDYYSFHKPNIDPPNPGAVPDNRMILDVGCGAGSWLCYLVTIGCVNLYGCDPFIENDISYANGVKIKKCSIHEMEGEYDVIHLSHSFEHMPNPHEVFKSFDRLLKHTKRIYDAIPKIEITIPIFPNAAFDMYGPFWYQMDPPRHFFLHSVKSMQMLADEAGFKIKSVDYQGSEGQFMVSRMYQMGVPFIEYGIKLMNDSKFSSLKNQLPMFKDLSSASVAAKYSDQALFTLIRKEN